MVECRGTLTDALGGNRGYDFAANAAGYAGSTREIRKSGASLGAWLFQNGAGFQ